MLKELSEEDFKRRAARSGRVAVFKEFLADRETPVAALTRLGDDEEAFLLESVSGGEVRGRYSYLGIDPYARFEGDGAIDKVRAELAAAKYEAVPELPSFQGGAVGYVAYDAVRSFEPSVGLRTEAGTPSAAFLMCGTVLVFDNVRDTVMVVVVVDVKSAPSLGEVFAAARERIASVYDRLLSAESIARFAAERIGNGGSSHTGEFKPEMTREEFRAIVSKCKDAIRAGEVIQIVPSQKFTADTSVSALSLYRALRMVNPSPYNFFLRLGSKTLIGSSPEELVKLSGRIASTAPIAGTRPRGASSAEDAALERELLADEKERAEHVMLVDLGRNDLGRVSEIGSVKVERYAHVERYSHVMHLVSNVRGTLAAGCDAVDLLKAAFPAGTLSGAPKVRAMQLIAEFEKSPRGVYGGAAGYFSFTGDMDFAIVIRTLVLENGTLTLRTGAGIVADSDPDREYDETINKAKAAFEAVRFAEKL